MQKTKEGRKKHNPLILSWGVTGWVGSSFEVQPNQMFGLHWFGLLNFLSSGSTANPPSWSRWLAKLHDVAGVMQAATQFRVRERCRSWHKGRCGSSLLWEEMRSWGIPADLCSIMGCGGRKNVWQWKKSKSLIVARVQKKCMSYFFSSFFSIVQSGSVFTSSLRP